MTWQSGDTGRSPRESCSSKQDAEPGYQRWSTSPLLLPCFLFSQFCYKHEYRYMERQQVLESAMVWPQAINNSCSKEENAGCRTHPGLALGVACRVSSNGLQTQRGFTSFTHNYHWVRGQDAHSNQLHWQ